MNKIHSPNFKHTAFATTILILLKIETSLSKLVWFSVQSIERLAAKKRIQVVDLID